MDDELPDTACDFVHARGARFNEGVGGVVFFEEMGRWSSKGQGRDLMINVLYRTTCTELCDVFNDSFMFMLCQGGIDYVRSNLFD